MQFIHISQFTIQDESGLKGRKLVELQKTQMKGGGSNRHEYLLCIKLLKKMASRRLKFLFHKIKTRRVYSDLSTFYTFG